MTRATFVGQSASAGTALGRLHHTDPASADSGAGLFDPSEPSVSLAHASSSRRVIVIEDNDDARELLRA